MDLATQIALNLIDGELAQARRPLAIVRSHLRQAELMAALHHQDTLPITTALGHIDCIEHLLPPHSADSAPSVVTLISESNEQA